MISFPFKIEPLHWEEYTRHWKRLQKATEKRSRLGLVGAVLIFAGLGVSLAAAGYIAIVVSPLAWLLVALPAALTVLIAHAVITGSRKSRDLPVNRRSGDLTINESGIHWRYIDGCEIEIDWPGFESWVVLENTIILRESMVGDLHIIPRLPSASERLKVTSTFLNKQERLKVTSTFLNKQHWAAQRTRRILPPPRADLHLRGLGINNQY